MSISKLASVVTSNINANSLICVTPNTLYTAVAELKPGIYTITCAAATNTTVFFYSDATSIALQATTVNGVITVNLGTAAVKIGAFTNTGTNVAVSIEMTANALTNNFNGTLDVVTTSGTYTGTSASGFAYAVLYGAGGGGSSDYSSYIAIGGNGGCAEKIVQLTGSMPVTIGLGGTSVNAGVGNPGGASTFNGMTANGGAGGRYNDWTTPIPGGTATGGTFNTQGWSGGMMYGQDGPSRMSGSLTPVFKFAGTIPLAPGGNWGNEPIYASPGYVYNGNRSGKPGVLYVLKY